MGIQAYRLSDYDHAAKAQQFETLRLFLEEQYKHHADECLLIGNCHIGSLELDALLINNGGFRLLEFKNLGGDVIACENDTWTANGMTIDGGADNKTPLMQMRNYKRMVGQWVQQMCGLESPPLSATIVFTKDATFDTSQLADNTKTWLHVCDNFHIGKILDGMSHRCLTNDFIRSFPRLLRIEDFDLRDTLHKGIGNEAFEPETATDLFEELEQACKHRPDYAKIYTIYNEVFQKCLSQNTSHNRIILVGTFSKTDYLLKEFRASKDLIQRTNDTRSRLRKKRELTMNELQEYYLHDLRNLCQFIALIYRVKIPASLERTFPATDRKKPVPALMTEYMRVIVEQWDKKFVYCAANESADGGTVKICYANGNKTYDYDWTYLHDMFYQGAQLNIIRPRENNGVIYPELIVFEPDYLVDISTVAKCFENYAESPYVNLIKKLQPSAISEAIVLGNFAGQLLDEQIHQLPDTRSYKDSVTEFWKNNSITLLTVALGKNFHNDAQRQKKNIAHAIGTVLSKEVSNFDLKEGMVEPSFFSEMLGLQGRMDYLQLDYKVLLEQKSGKGEFPYDNFIRPQYKEEHYVQMLLYMMLIRYNFREIYEKNHHEIRAFLLYSKYTESLIGLGFATELIFRALKIRNGLAWTELRFTQENAIRILDTLTPAKMNLKQVDNVLWKNYQYRQIEAVLLPIQQASELEKAYYFRFLTFIANEHVLSKLGNKTKENSGFASKWHDSLEEKLRAGNIYDKLTLIYPETLSEGNIKEVKLLFSEDPNHDISNFRVGDIVILYAYENDTEPDARKTMVFRSTIKRIETDTIELLLRAKQSDAKIFLRNKNKPWAIEHDFMESSYSLLYRGMHAFLSAPKARRDLLLFQRVPETDHSATIRGDYGDFNELSLRIKKAKDFFLLIGPPGTGKTSFGLLNTLREELSEPDGTILLLSYTNRAVDEICSKLYKDGIDFFRIGGELSCAASYKDKLLSERAQHCHNVDELKKIIVSTRVFVATTTSMDSHIDLFKIKQFSLVIIDEASQILEPHLIGILSAHNNGVSAIRKMVLIGDHKQLPAVVQQKTNVSTVQDVALNDILLEDCRLSLFERLLKKYRDNKDVVYMLKRQGRMHHDIALFPNYAFYNNQLEEVPLPHQDIVLPLDGHSRNGIDNMLQTRRVVFINAESPVESISDKVNQTEAEVIAATIRRVYENEKGHFDAEKTVGVIVPYRNQIATVRNSIDQFGIEPLHHITIDTVERYQGSQRKYIVYGFTIRKYYQLHFLTDNVFKDFDGSIIDRKLNVAMTRAEEHLIMVGDAALLSNNLTFYKLIEFVRSKHGYFDVPHEQYVRGEFAMSPHETADVDISQASYTTSDQFRKAFHRLVVQPIKDDSTDGWPGKVFGYDMLTNLNAIGYGRTNCLEHLHMFDGGSLSTDRQVLLYCYCFMRQHYCSSRTLYATYKDWIAATIRAVDGRLHFIDIGCGPATCGIAFSEIFHDVAPNMVYTGIDISTAMTSMGKQLMNEILSADFHFQMKESFSSLNNSWQGCSEVPSLVIVNIAYFFSNISSRCAEQLAHQIAHVMKTYPINYYVFFIQYSKTDKKLESLKVFKSILTPHVRGVKEETTGFSYTVHSKEQIHSFCYNLWTNK